MRAQGIASRPECFVIMPVTDPEGYVSGHFQHVFNDIFTPACEIAGYQAIRADQIKETNLIHLDVLQRLLSSPMVLCDLSSRNPNVLFELGLRQAFDKPVVLVQEHGTPKIFDIAPLRYTEYRSARIYHEVLDDQRAIAAALVATREAFENDAGINSIVRILSLTKPASFLELKEASRDPALQLIRAELSELRSDLRRAIAPAQSALVTQDKNVEFLQSLAEEIDIRLENMRKGGNIDNEVPELISQLKSTAAGLSSSVRHNSELQRVSHIVGNIKGMEQEYLALTGQPIWQGLKR
jgi:hypothetical protein